MADRAQNRGWWTALIALTVLFFAIVPAADAFACASEATPPQHGQAWSEPAGDAGETTDKAMPGHCPHGACQHAASLPAAPLAVPAIFVLPLSRKARLFDASNPSQDPQGPDRPPRA